MKKKIKAHCACLKKKHKKQTNKTTTVDTYDSIYWVYRSTNRNLSLEQSFLSSVFTGTLSIQRAHDPSVLQLRSLFAGVCETGVSRALWDHYFLEKDPFFFFFLTLVLIVNAKYVHYKKLMDYCGSGVE